MSNSSLPKNSLENLTFDSKQIEDLLKECTIDLSGTGASSTDYIITTAGSTYNSTYDYGTITINPTPSTYTISTMAATDNITLTSLDSSNFIFNIPEEWKDSFPNWDRVQDMCNKYPGLRIAFDNFKVFYEMVKDDYDNPTPKK